MNARAIDPVVRNPLLQLPAAQRIAQLPPDARAALAQLLREIGADAQVRADAAWKRHKGPMACYWKAVGVYARHAARLARSGPQQQPVRP